MQNLETSQVKKKPDAKIFRLDEKLQSLESKKKLLFSQNTKKLLSVDSLKNSSRIEKYNFYEKLSLYLIFMRLLCKVMPYVYKIYQI